MTGEEVIKASLKTQSWKCKNDFFYFLQVFWDAVIKETAIYNWHIPYLCSELQMIGESIIRRDKKPYDLIINVPPGSTKSTVCTIMFPAWLWANDATLRIISNSYSRDLSEEHASKTKDIITTERYRLLFPDVMLRQDSRGKSTYTTTTGGERRPTSTGSAATGRHAHVILNDDPLDITKAESEAYRNQAINKMKELDSRKVDKENTPIITIMQRLHEEDVTGYLLKQGNEVRHLCLPAELSNNVMPVELRARYEDGLLDVKRLNLSVIKRAKKTLGSRGYAGQYAQVPVADGGNIIKASWFGKISLSMFESLRGTNPIHFFLDTAYDEKKSSTDNDPSGIIVCCKIQGKMYVSDAQKVYKEFPDLCRWLVLYAKNHGYTRESTVRIEPMANGKSVIQMLRKFTKLNVTQTPPPKDSKTVKLTAQAPRIECGRVVLVEGMWNDEFVDELCYAMDYFLNDEDEADEWETLAELELR
jgi:hypothetical protein